MSNSSDKRRNDNAMVWTILWRNKKFILEVEAELQKSISQSHAVDLIINRGGHYSVDKDIILERLERIEKNQKNEWNV